MTACASLLTGGKSIKDPEPPQCEREKPVEGYAPIDPASFALAPSPLILPPGADWGDGPTVIAAIRKSINQYNKTVPPNLETQSKNLAKIIDAHNKAVVERNAECDRLWATWRKVVDLNAKKRAKAVSKF